MARENYFSDECVTMYQFSFNLHRGFDLYLDYFCIELSDAISFSFHIVKEMYMVVYSISQ